MSAFHVDTECFGKVLKAISKAGAYGPRHNEILKLKDQYNKNPGKVLVNLINLNRLSLDERYPEDSKDMYVGVNQVKAVWLSKQLGHNDVGLYKSLSCFLYQACEGKAVKKSLYKTLSAIQDVFAHDLVRQVPGYEDAKWG